MRSSIWCILALKYDRKIAKIVATGCHILRLKCTKFKTPLGELTALPRPPSQISRVSLESEGGGKKGEGEGGINLPNGCLKNLAALLLQTQQ